MQVQDQNIPPVIIIEEPPLHAEDTTPTKIQNPQSAQKWIGWLLSALAGIITIIAATLYLAQAKQPAITSTNSNNPAVISVDNATVAPTSQPVQAIAVNNDGSVPADVLAELLAQPGDTAPPTDKIYRMQIAYTVAPVRARIGVIQYTIQSGDNLQKIADKFGLAQETIVWNNDGIYVNRLFPGDQLTILPQDGVQFTTKGGETIQSIADTYKVSPYAIIDSEYNKLQNTNPTFVLPPGIPVIIPGGVSEKKAVYWDPGIVVKPAVPGPAGFNPAAYKNGEQITFGGGPGSCGYQPNVGNPALGNPLPPGTYSIRRGFSAIHSGIDLADPIGTPVYAAGTGTVIFAGWSDWGYGYSVVLTHGNLMTLYGHLSRISVSCGQQVPRGAQIGAVGSTGNSTGPHLHFEIRVNGVPVDPTTYLTF